MNEAPEKQEVPFAAFVGFDWADQKHAGALCPADGRVETFELKQTPQAIDDWATRLRKRFNGRPIAVCLEQSKGALIYALMKYEFFVLYPVNPKQSKRFREAMEPSGAKNDPGDAELILQLLLKHRDRLHAWTPDDEHEAVPWIIHFSIMMLLIMVSVALGASGSVTLPLGFGINAFWPSVAVQYVGSIWFGGWGIIAAAFVRGWFA